MPPKRKGAAATATPTDGKDFSKLKVAELRDECTQHGLDSSGKKADLVHRLEEYEKNNGSKKIKKEEVDGDVGNDEPLSMKEKLKKLADEERQTKRKTFQTDSNFPHGGCIVDEYDCMLNQTNIGHNNNKFYIIQLIETSSGIFYVWNRWGRVGETGSSADKYFGGNIEGAMKEFKKKFRDKTKNSWDDRENFTPHSGKYTLIEMDTQEEETSNVLEEQINKLESDPSNPVVKKKFKPCSLDKPTQSLIKLLFDHDMFKDAMAKLNIDVKKMPLGKLSKTQIAKGFAVLEELEDAIKNKKRGDIERFTSQFYTVVPHCFGRSRPPVIGDEETLRGKYDMLMILADIEIAQNLQKVEVKQEEEEVEHPLDVNYNLLNCGLKHVDNGSDTFKMLEEYSTNTGHNLKLLNVWEVGRDGEDKRFAEHDALDNRKLLWHGTNVAVVVAILKSGLRIMPHSGGRVGQGIYFASENGKSSCYVGCSRDRTGIMFLNEVALGKQNIIHRDDSSLKKAPDGYDSVLAQGQQEPDPKEDVKIKIEGKDVVVPKGKPKKNPSVTSSSFYQSEYLIYKESQNRIRYLLSFKF